LPNIHPEVIRKDSQEEFLIGPWVKINRRYLYFENINHLMMCSTKMSQAKTTPFLPDALNRKACQEITLLFKRNIFQPDIPIKQSISLYTVSIQNQGVPAGQLERNIVLFEI
jgi:hypothetical protein